MHQILFTSEFAPPTAKATVAGQRTGRQRVSLANLGSLIRECSPAVVALPVSAWGDVAVLRAELRGAGAVTVPPLGFSGIAVFAGTGDGRLFPCTSMARTRASSIGPNALIIHGRADTFRYEWSGDHSVTWISVGETLLQRAAADLEVDSYLTDGSLRVIRRGSVFRHFHEVVVQEADRPRHLAQGRIVEAVGTALAYHLVAGWRSSVERATARGGLSGRSFGRVTGFIDANLGEHLTLEDLAKAAGLSRFHFARQFRVRTGESPMGFLLRARINRAKLLLRVPEARICDVAAELGFADQSHFARTFRRMVGMPPSQFVVQGMRAHPC